MRRLRTIRALVVGWLLRRLVRSRRFLAFLRRLPFIPRIGRQRWVTRHEEVLEVLREDRRYGVPYLPKMEALGVPFVLGLDDGVDYRREHAALARVVREADLQDIRGWSAHEAERVLAGAGGSVDAVGELADAVVARTIGAYLGVGTATARTLADARDVFRDVFINTLEDPEATERAGHAARRLRRKVRGVVEDRRAAMLRGADDRDDLVGRLLRTDAREGAARLDVDVLAANVTGLLVAWAAQVPRTVGFAFDVMLDDPRALAAARAAALAGDRAAVERALFEALRFQPSAPAIERVCVRETRLRGRTIRRGAPVLAVVASAMMDSDAVEAPGEFRPGRPADAHLHFGHGLHTCLGRHVGRVQMEAIGTALLRRHDLRRAGPLRLRGPYPRELRVTFGPVAA